MKRLIVLLMIVMCSTGVCGAAGMNSGTSTLELSTGSYYTDEVCEICGKSLREYHEGSSNYGYITDASSCVIGIAWDIEAPNYLQSRSICLCDDCYGGYKKSFKLFVDKWLKEKQKSHKADRERHEKQREAKKKKDARAEIERKIEELTKLLRELKK